METTTTSAPFRSAFRARKLLLASVATAVLFSSVGLAQSPVAVSAPLPLPSSKMLYAVPGSPQRTNSLPTATAVSPDGRYVLLLNAGFGTAESQGGQSIGILDRSTGKLTDYADERLRQKRHQTYFFGLALSEKGDEVYASVASMTDPEGKQSGNTGSGIAVHAFKNGRLTPSRFIRIPLQPLPAGKKYPRDPKVPKGSMDPYPAGLAVLPGERLLVTGNLSDQVWLLNSRTGQILKTFDVSDPSTEWIPATMPYTVVSDGKNAWVSMWNTASVAELDLASGGVKRISLDEPRGTETSSSHATALALDAAHHVLYVTLANTDEVVSVDTRTSQVISRANVRLPKQRAGGAYPNALALNADGSRLYVAEAGTNSVAVLETNRGKLTEPRGFLPTEYYPTALAWTHGELVIASGKGRGTGPNSGSPSALDRKKWRYIAGLTYGSVARVPEREITSNLAKYSAQVYRSNLLEESQSKLDFRNSGHDSSPIRHVIYIIKENRTYDQLLGDLGVGDGDAKLAMFGEEITPNHHKLARQFGVLDNFYDSGEISGNGHVWSTAGITSDYTEKIWPINYRNAERSYDYEGGILGEFPMYQHIPDVNEPSTGYLWTNAARNHLTYRHYGEFVNTEWCEAEEVDSPASTGASVSACEKKSIPKGEELPEWMASQAGEKSPWPWTIPMIANNVPTKPELAGHFDPKAADFKLEYPDQFRANEFLREFRGFVEARQNGDVAHEMPNLVVLRLPNDHTMGTRAGKPTPAAMMKDNDLALGRVVDAVSHSPYWDDTAILVLEDDAQDGPDHVDAHRSLALVISKYAPRTDTPRVEHNFYTTVHMIRTLEDLLGMPPMNHNDAQVSPMIGEFTGKGDQPAYEADRRHENDGSLYELNPPDAPGAKASAKMDFSKEDRVDSAKLNKILWRVMMGNDRVPKSRYTVFPPSRKVDDDD